MNWSLMLNALLLMGVVIAIVRTVQARRQQEVQTTQQPTTHVAIPNNTYDDIIAVRKVDHGANAAPVMKPSIVVPVRQPTISHGKVPMPRTNDANLVTKAADALQEVKQVHSEPVTNHATPESIMIFLLAKSNRQLAGYDLLQAVLSAGFRFGEGGLFHRHQYPNCQGPVMCSLAAATPTGVFDLQNIGGFVVHGLCLFMRISGQKGIDAERFDMLLDTAKTLSESLDTHLLDELREPLTEQSVIRYHQKLQLNEEQVCE